MVTQNCQPHGPSSALPPGIRASVHDVRAAQYAAVAPLQPPVPAHSATYWHRNYSEWPMPIRQHYCQHCMCCTSSSAHTANTPVVPHCTMAPVRGMRPTMPCQPVNAPVRCLPCVPCNPNNSTCDSISPPSGTHALCMLAVSHPPRHTL